MKNDILFRGIRMDNHEWVEGYYCKYPHKFSEFLNDYILVLEYDAETETAICMTYQIDSESVEVAHKHYEINFNKEMSI